MVSWRGRDGRRDDGWGWWGLEERVGEREGDGRVRSAWPGLRSGVGYSRKVDGVEEGVEVYRTVCFSRWMAYPKSSILVFKK